MVVRHDRRWQWRGRWANDENLIAFFGWVARVQLEVKLLSLKSMQLIDELRMSWTSIIDPWKSLCKAELPHKVLAPVAFSSINLPLDSPHRGRIFALTTMGEYPSVDRSPSNESTITSWTYFQSLSNFNWLQEPSTANVSSKSCHKKSLIDKPSFSFCSSRKSRLNHLQ